MKKQIKEVIDPEEFKELFETVNSPEYEEKMIKAEALVLEAKNAFLLSPSTYNMFKWIDALKACDDALLN